MKTMKTKFNKETLNHLQKAFDLIKSGEIELNRAIKEIIENQTRFYIKCREEYNINVGMLEDVRGFAYTSHQLLAHYMTNLRSDIPTDPILWGAVVRDLEKQHLVRLFNHFSKEQINLMKR